MQDPCNKYRSIGLMLLFASIVTLAAMWNFSDQLIAAGRDAFGH